MEFTRKKKDMSFLDSRLLASNEMEIILTQKCNLSCEHCMRGNSTNKEISAEVLDAIFDKFFYIENLSLGGGEISLSPHLIKLLTQKLKEHKTIIHHVNFTSNGVFVTDEFLDALNELREYVISCDDKTHFFESEEENLAPLVCCFSFDDFHLQSMINKGIEFEQLYQTVAKYQQRFSRSSIECRMASDVDVINAGRAESITDNIHKIKTLSPSEWLYYYLNSKSQPVTLFGGIIEFSCDGEVIPPNIPFANEKALSFGNILTDKPSTIFANMTTKEVSSHGFNHETNKMFKKLTAPKPLWNKYLKSYGYKKLHIFRQKVDEYAEKSN